VLQDSSQVPLDATQPSLPRTRIPNKRSSRPVFMDQGNSYRISELYSVPSSYFRGEFLALVFRYRAGTNGFDGKLQMFEGEVARSLAKPKVTVRFVRDIWFI
jgi:hypothetical protein